MRKGPSIAGIVLLLAGPASRCCGAEHVGKIVGEVLIEVSPGKKAEGRPQTVYANGPRQKRLCKTTRDSSRFECLDLPADGAWLIRVAQHGYRMDGDFGVHISTTGETTVVVVLVPERPAEPPARQPAQAASRILLVSADPPQISRDSMCPPIRGSVVSGGRPLAGAEVEASYRDGNTDVPLQRTTTGYSGEFQLQMPLPSGVDVYTLTISKPGYDLFLGALSRCVAPPAIVELRPYEEVSKSIDQSYLITLFEPSRRYTFLPAGLRSLPLSGFRSADSLALLLPGIAPPPPPISPVPYDLDSRGATGGQFAANGMRTRENNFTVDVSDNNDEDLGVRRSGFVAPLALSPEAIEEYQVITALGDARFGRNIGAQVNTLSRSGAARHHGTLYGFGTNHRFNARNFFDSMFTGQDHSFTRTQTGFEVGGPVSRSAQPRTFFHLFAERQHLRSTQEAHFSVPEIGKRGFLDTGLTGFSGRTAAEGPEQHFYPASVVGNALFSLYPFPNNPGGPYGSETYTALLPANGAATLFAAKLDRQLPWFGGSTLSARYAITDEDSISPAVGGALYSSIAPKVRIQNAAVFLHTVFSAASAQTLRLSMGRTSSQFDEVRDQALIPSGYLPDTPFLLNAPMLLNIAPNCPPSEAGLAPCPYVRATSREGERILRQLGYDAWLTGTPGITTEHVTGPLGQLKLAGFSPVGVDPARFPQKRTNNTFQLSQTTTHIRGRNTFTAGADIRNTRLQTAVEQNYRPLAEFHGLRTFYTEEFGTWFPSLTGVRQVGELFSPTSLAALGIPTGLFHTIAVNPHPDLGVRFSQINFFVQDEIALRRDLRLTLGLRYELNTVPKSEGLRLERAFESARFLADAAAIDARLETQIRAYLPFAPDFHTAFNSDRNNLQPRVGFAWDVPGTGRTVVRGGFGLYHGQFPGVVMNLSRNVFPDFLPLNYAHFPSRVGSPQILFNLAHPAIQQYADTPQIVQPGTLNTLAAGDMGSGAPLHVINDSIRRIATGVGAVPSVARVPGEADRAEDSRVQLGLLLPGENLKNAYAFHYGLTLEQRIGAYVASLSYLGTGGRHLLRALTPALGSGPNGIRGPQLHKYPQLYQGFSFLRPIGEGIPFPVVRGYVDNTQLEYIVLENGRYVLKDPIGTQFGDIRSFSFAPTFFSSDASSSYQSLQAEVRRRYAPGLQFTAGFTWSHSIDHASDIFDNAGAFALPQNSAFPSERGPSNFDVRLRATAHFVWQPDAFAWFRSVRLLRALELSGVVIAQTGQPYTVNSSVDYNRDGNATDRLHTTDGLLYGGRERRVRLRLVGNPWDMMNRDGYRALHGGGAVGRNTFRSHELISLDLALMRHFQISDAARITVRIEAFNAFNRANFAIPVRILEAGAFGASVSTVNPARVLQLALKFSF